MSTPDTTERSRTASILERAAAHEAGLWQPDTVFVRGEGVHLWDADGKQYLDCMAGIAVASVGHANPRLAAAMQGRVAARPPSGANCSIF